MAGFQSVRSTPDEGIRACLRGMFLGWSVERFEGNVRKRNNAQNVLEAREAMCVWLLVV
jgi:hypothetical protein